MGINRCPQHHLTVKLISRKERAAERLASQLFRGRGPKGDNNMSRFEKEVVDSFNKSHKTHYSNVKEIVEDYGTENVFYDYVLGQREEIAEEADCLWALFELLR